MVPPASLAIDRLPGVTVGGFVPLRAGSSGAGLAMARRVARVHLAVNIRPRETLSEFVPFHTGSSGAVLAVAFGRPRVPVAVYECLGETNGWFLGIVR